jgi:hypothetical protein
LRGRLRAGDAAEGLLTLLLRRCQEQRLLKARGTQRTDSTHVLAAIRILNRVELVGETLRHALNSLTVHAPEWVAAHCPGDWAVQYGRRFEQFRLPHGQAAREQLALQIGADGWRLREALDAPETPDVLRALPAVLTLAAVWRQQFYSDRHDVTLAGRRQRAACGGDDPIAL